MTKTNYKIFNSKKASLLIVIILLFVNFSGNAQNLTMAKAFYKKAQKEYERKNYSQVIMLLEKTKENLNGETNPDIIYLEAFSRYKSDVNIKKTKKLLEEFVNQANSNDQRIDNVTSALVDIESSNWFDKDGNFLDLKNRSGKILEYYENGDLKSERTIDKGKIVGDWVFYDKKKNVVIKRSYNDDKEIEQGVLKLTDDLAQEFKLVKSNNWESSNYINLIYSSKEQNIISGFKTLKIEYQNSENFPETLIKKITYKESDNNESFEIKTISFDKTGRPQFKSIFNVEYYVLGSGNKSVVSEYLNSVRFDKKLYFPLQEYEFDIISNKWVLTKEVKQIDRYKGKIEIISYDENGKLKEKVSIKKGNITNVYSRK